MEKRGLALSVFLILAAAMFASNLNTSPTGNPVILDQRNLNSENFIDGNDMSPIPSECNFKDTSTKNWLGDAYKSDTSALPNNIECVQYNKKCSSGKSCKAVRISISNVFECKCA